MIASDTFQGRTVAVFGLARSGLSAVRALKAGGTEVVAWDDKEDFRDAARSAGAKIVPWSEWPWDRLAGLVLSPGVPLTHPKPHDVVLRAREWDVEVFGDIEIFARAARCHHHCDYRHQRQIYHDRIDRPYPQRSWL